MRWLFGGRSDWRVRIQYVQDTPSQLPCMSVMYSTEANERCANAEDIPDSSANTSPCRERIPIRYLYNPFFASKAPFKPFLRL
jgi:hypothetical protein